MNITTIPAWRGFDVWLNRDPRRRPEQISEHSGICHRCDALVDHMAHADPVARTTPWNQNLCPECWERRRSRKRPRHGDTDSRAVGRAVDTDTRGSTCGGGWSNLDRPRSDGREYVNTINVQYQFGELMVHRAEIDALEQGQPLGKRAKQVLADKVPARRFPSRKSIAIATGASEARSGSMVVTSTGHCCWRLRLGIQTLLTG